MKNIEWLKKEIHKELESWYGVEGGIDEEGINKIMLLINQFEESKVKQLERKIKELDSYNDELIRDNNQLRNELDSQEVLSSDWIAGKKMWTRNKIPFHMGVDYAVPVNDLQNLLVPKQELPVIPKFVAEWIDSRKNSYPSDVIGVYLRMNESFANEQTREVLSWVHESELNRGTFARAWLDGYEVEEEPLYRARLKVITDEFIASYLCTQSSDAEDRLKALEIGSKYIHEDYRHLSEFTEDELKRLDIWDSKQWELEEME